MAVGENDLQVEICLVRKTLQEDTCGESYLVTVPGRGYRLVGLDTLAQGPALPDKPSIAVLPFENMSDDPGQDYFADGIVEDIITALCRIRWLFVIARNSSFSYKGRAVDIKQVGRELGVRYVLEGRVRKDAQRVRITAQLVDAASGMHLWADHFDSGIENIFDLQDRVTESVVGTSVQDGARAHRLLRHHRKRPAHQMVLQSRGSWSRPRSSAPSASPPTALTLTTTFCAEWRAHIE